MFNEVNCRNFDEIRFFALDTILITVSAMHLESFLKRIFRFINIF